MLSAGRNLRTELGSHLGGVDRRLGRGRTQIVPNCVPNFVVSNLRTPMPVRRSWRTAYQLGGSICVPTWGPICVPTWGSNLRTNLGVQSTCFVVRNPEPMVKRVPTWCSNMRTNLVFPSAYTEGVEREGTSICVPAGGPQRGCLNLRTGGGLKPIVHDPVLQLEEHG